MPVSCSFAQRVDVEVRRRIVNRSGGLTFPCRSSGRDGGVGRAAAARRRRRDAASAAPASPDRHIEDAKRRTIRNVRASSGIDTL